MHPPRTNLFLDTEFSGLHQSAQLISLALVPEPLLPGRSRAFYAELTDYDPTRLSDWHREFVLPNLLLGDESKSLRLASGTHALRGDSAAVRDALNLWIAPLGPVEIWADVLAWDWVLFCELFGGSFGIPTNVFYIPFDLATLFRLLGDPDTSREDFAFPDTTARAAALSEWGGFAVPAHNALWDAQVSRACYRRLQAMPPFSKR